MDTRLTQIQDRQWNSIFQMIKEWQAPTDIGLLVELPSTDRVRVTKTLCNYTTNRSVKIQSMLVVRNPKLYVLQNVSVGGAHKSTNRQSRVDKPPDW